MTLQERQEKLWAIYLDIAENKHKESDIKKLKILAKTINKIDRLLIDSEIAKLNRENNARNWDKLIKYLQQNRIPEIMLKYIKDEIKKGETKRDEAALKEQLQKEPLRTYCNGLYNSILELDQEEKLKEIFNTGWYSFHILLTSKTEIEAKEQLKIVKNEILKLNIVELMRSISEILNESQRNLLGYIMDFQS